MISEKYIEEFANQAIVQQAKEGDKNALGQAREQHLSSLEATGQHDRAASLRARLTSKETSKE